MNKKNVKENRGNIIYPNIQKQYELIDCGNGRKLERYNDIIINRPENQAIWKPQKNQKIWQQAHAVFSTKKEEEGIGRWKFPKGEIEQKWEMKLNNINFLARFTSFRHLGVFPEQTKHWDEIHNVIMQNKKNGKIKMLNLFGYTGVASLVGANAGAEVTHVDASKKAIGWARENQEVAGMGDKPIRWIVDDAMKFCAREIRRDKKYDVVILDPPAYGRGPKGEVWQLMDDLAPMMKMIRQLQSQKPMMTILTCYAIRLSSLALHEIMKEMFRDTNGSIDSGELVLKNKEESQFLSTSLFARFKGEKYE